MIDGEAQEGEAEQEAPLFGAGSRPERRKLRVIDPGDKPIRRFARLDLSTVDAYCKEGNRVYRLVKQTVLKAGDVDVDAGVKLIGMLEKLANLKVNSELEARIEALEGGDRE